MNPETISYDIEYYKRAIEKVYQDHYKKRVIFLIILLGLEVFVSFFSTWTWVNTVLTGGLLVGLIYMTKQLKSFESFMNQEKEQVKLVQFAEDKKHYYILEENLKLNKKDGRNLPSKEKGLTFFIGIDPYKLSNPIHVRYYDMLELTYTDSFRQNKANISYSRSRWKYRITSWVKSIPLILILIYIFGFRLSFIWVGIKNLLTSLF